MGCISRRCFISRRWRCWRAKARRGRCRAAGREWAAPPTVPLQPGAGSSRWPATTTTLLLARRRVSVPGGVRTDCRCCWRAASSAAGSRRRRRINTSSAAAAHSSARRSSSSRSSGCNSRILLTVSVTGVILTALPLHTEEAAAGGRRRPERGSGGGSSGERRRWSCAPGAISSVRVRWLVRGRLSVVVLYAATARRRRRAGGGVVQKCEAGGGAPCRRRTQLLRVSFAYSGSYDDGAFLAAVRSTSYILVRCARAISSSVACRAGKRSEKTVAKNNVAVRRRTSRKKPLWTFQQRPIKMIQTWRFRSSREAAKPSSRRRRAAHTRKHPTILSSADA